MPRPTPLLTAILTLPLAACASVPDGYTPLPVAEAPAFDPLAFFAGRSEGRGELKKVLSGRVPVLVSSEGTVASDGTLTLVQTVEEDDKPPRTRQWILRETVRGRYVGTLTDALGPVTAQSEGNRLTITYTMKDGYAVEQVLTLAPDGQSASNVMTVGALGAPLAVLTEEIVRVP